MRRPRRKLLLTLSVLLTVMAVVTLALFARGTWASERRVPAGIAEGPVCYVHQDSTGEKEVRCAIRLPVPMDEVWAALTDYEHFGDICSCIHAEQTTHEPDGLCRLKARANSLPPGQMPFAVEMRHEQKLDQYISSWDQSSGALLVNRGQWILTPMGPRETLLEVSLEIQIRRIPTFILRNISMGRLRDAALAVDRRLRDGPSGKTW
ncbi:MAG TPA: hypothetical protein VN688_32480 [Gemmataceae bacterium]|nr:hypothetical protein [Gemmataceae bacterium]